MKSPANHNCVEPSTSSALRQREEQKPLPLSAESGHKQVFNSQDDLPEASDCISQSVNQPLEVASPVISHRSLEDQSHREMRKVESQTEPQKIKTTPVNQFYDFQEQTLPRTAKSKKFSKLNNSLQIAKKQQKTKKKKRVIRIYPQTNLTTLEKDPFSSNSCSLDGSHSIELQSHLEVKQEEPSNSIRDSHRRGSLLPPNRTHLVSNILLRQKMSTRSNLPTFSVRHRTTPHLPCLAKEEFSEAGEGGLNRSTAVQSRFKKRKYIDEDDSLGISLNYEDIVKRGFEKEKESEDEDSFSQIEQDMIDNAYKKKEEVKEVIEIPPQEEEKEIPTKEEQNYDIESPKRNLKVSPARLSLNSVQHTNLTQISSFDPHFRHRQVTFCVLCCLSIKQRHSLVRLTQYGRVPQPLSRLTAVSSLFAQIYTYVFLQILVSLIVVDDDSFIAMMLPYKLFDALLVIFTIKLPLDYLFKKIPRRRTHQIQPRFPNLNASYECPKSLWRRLGFIFVVFLLFLSTMVSFISIFFMDITLTLHVFLLILFTLLLSLVCEFPVIYICFFRRIYRMERVISSSPQVQ